MAHARGRLMSLLLLLQNRGRMTAAELATELEVSVRTIYRDVDARTRPGFRSTAMPVTRAAISCSPGIAPG